MPPPFPAGPPTYASDTGAPRGTRSRKSARSSHAGSPPRGNRARGRSCSRSRTHTRTHSPSTRHGSRHASRHSVAWSRAASSVHESTVGRDHEHQDGNRRTGPLAFLTSCFGGRNSHDDRDGDDYEQHSGRSGPQSGRGCENGGFKTLWRRHRCLVIMLGLSTLIIIALAIALAVVASKQSGNGGGGNRFTVVSGDGDWESNGN
ncbi:hypothetical protein FQN54_005131 [Arachnomyces sp. PD_36]|nr:hypothetical protein FQN54_005131 [Arachnomyces sp. PD_36]